MLRTIALLSTAIAAPSLFADEYTFQYSFASGGDPADVAVFANCDARRWVFVADWGVHRLLRYNSDGASNTLSAVSDIVFDQGPSGVAVNDLPGHCNNGQVYACDFDGTTGYVLVFDSNLAVIKQIGITGGFIQPSGICVDAEGNVYVADTGQNKTYKIDSADLGPPFFVGQIVTPALTFTSILGPPEDCSVDHNGRLHVTNECNCYLVFEPSGVLISPVSGGLPLVVPEQGICALNPMADGLISLETTGCVRYNWDWLGPDGALDGGFGSGVANARGLEYQKFCRTSLLGPWGSFFRTTCDERVFVADRSNGRIAVYGKSMVSVPRPPNCVAWYRFEETHPICSGGPVLLRDSCGANSAWTTGAPRTVEGMVRCALDTQGGTAWATAPNSSSLNFGTNSMTIEGWVRTEQKTGTITLVDKRVGMGAGYSVFLTSGRLGFQTNIGGDVYHNYAPGGDDDRIASGSWRHFAIVLDRTLDNMIKVYVDCELVGATAALAGSISNTGPLFVGRVNTGASGVSLSGAIDELTFYNRALSQSEIQAVCDAGCAGKDLPGFVIPDSGRTARSLPPKPL